MKTVAELMSAENKNRKLRTLSFILSPGKHERCSWCNRHDAVDGERCSISETGKHEIRSDKDCPYCGTKGPHESNEASEQELIYLCKNEKCGEHFGPGTET